MKNHIMVEIPEETYKELLEVERKYLCIMKKFEEVLLCVDESPEQEEKLVELMLQLYRCRSKKLEKVLNGDMT